MGSGISVKLPLSLDPDDGIALNKTYNDVAKQNFINLLLTIPGERVMIPSFGVGMKKYLFESDTPTLRSQILADIMSQTSKYLSYIEIVKVNFQSSADNDYMDRNFLLLKIIYRIIPLGTIDEININRTDDDIVII